MKVGCEETALLGGPEARPELPALLKAGVMEEELRDRPAESSTWPPCKLTCEDKKVKEEPGPLMGEARAVTEDVRLGAGGMTA